MNITVVCDVLGKENNGSTVAANNLINYLRQRGHTVNVLCADESKAHEAGYYVVPQRNLLIFNKYVEANGVTLAKPDEAIIRSALCGADIVHIMFPFVLGITAAQIAKEINLPVTAGFHMLAENVTAHLRLENNEFASRLIYTHFYKLYKNCDAVHFPTQYLKKTYEKAFGQVNGYVISNGVNDIFKRKSYASSDDGYIKILSVGRYSKEKAQSILIDAVKLSVHKQKIQLIFAGDGPLKKELKKRSECLPVPPVFAFYSRQELVNVINSAYLYVHSAQIEAEGISCLEAMACGTVPVISDSEKCATKSYALTPNSLFKFGNASDLARKIDWWIDNPNQRNKYGTIYADYAERNFNQSDCMNQMEKMFSETIEKQYNMTAKCIDNFCGDKRCITKL